MARGFQEEIKSQSDRPTVSRDSFKLIVALSANEGFKLVSLDIRTAFLQAKVLDHDVFMVPPADVRKESKARKLLKPLYGLDDVSKKFWLKVRYLFLKMEMKTHEGDKAFYFKNDGGILKGAILTHVDDFTLAGEETFLEEVLKGIKTCMTVSKVAENSFR